MVKKVVGILGGVGPLATAYFMNMVINLTDAKKDQDHIDMIVLNHATIPDRTNFIMGKNLENPLPVMVKDAIVLQNMGCDFLVLPCNTAHYFFDSIKKEINIPIINIVEETINCVIEKNKNIKKIGLLATNGTIFSSTYERECSKRNIKCIVPNEYEQIKVMSLIYDQVKAGAKADVSIFLDLISSLMNRGCQAVILGCTELSVIKRDFNINLPYVVDSLESLAKRTILNCNKKIKE